ncbi:MAG: disulfide bond formation protein DsbD, partial [Bacteroidetes bacterium]
MKRIIFILLCCTHGIALMGQILHPANWEHNFSKGEVTVGDQVDLIFEITIDPKWYLYSSDFDPELGPKVTEFQFLADDSYQLVGGVRPIDAKESYDEIFEGNYTYFKGKGEFR